MSEFKGEDAYPSTAVLDRLRKNAVMCLAGGMVLIAVLLVSRALPILLPVSGAIACAVGIGWLLANNPVNRRIGIILLLVGVLQILSRLPLTLFRSGVPVVLNIFAMWLLATGVRNLVSYFITQGKRFS